MTVDREEEKFHHLQDLYWVDYINSVDSVLSTIPKNSTVLEIACGAGCYSDIFKKLDLKKYIGIDPDKDWLAEAAKRDYGCETDLVATTYEEYTPTEKIDVVVCAGLLYHLASPFHFFERIINVYRPKTIYLETTGEDTNKRAEFSTDPTHVPSMLGDRYYLGLTPESINSHGNRYGESISADLNDDSIHRTIPYNIIMSVDLIIHIFEILGCNIVNTTNITNDHLSKHKVCMMQIETNLSENT